MPEIPEKLVSYILLGLLSGLGIFGTRVVWSRFFRRFGESEPGVGLLIAVAFLIGETMVHGTTLRAWVAILLLAGAGLIPVSEKKTVLRLFLIAFGGVLLASWTITDKPLWLRASIVLGTVWLSSAFGGFDKRHAATNQTLLLLLVTMGGILIIVPDTEETALLFGALMAATLLVFPFRLSALGQTGTLPIAGLLAWIICINGYGRPASIVTSTGCLGLLVAAPLVYFVTKNKLNQTHQVTAPAGELIIHCISIAIVLYLARTTSNLRQAAVVAAVALGVSFVGLLVLVLLKWPWTESNRRHTV